MTSIVAGFKGEWCTVKGDLLYIGGMGKEWTNSKGVCVSLVVFDCTHATDISTLLCT
jgi:hypothetical protein